MSLNDKLNRFDSLLKPKSADTKQKVRKALPSRYQKMADRMNGDLCQAPTGTYVLVKEIYPFSYIHGKYELKEIHKDSQPTDAFLAEFKAPISQSKKLLFIDTETTALGGAGTVPFLVGVGSLTSKGFEVRQYLLPDYPDEYQMLEDIYKEFSDEFTLVSYNGASFDLPLIIDRMIINRVGREIPMREHIDLLHPVRRIFKKRLDSCKLTNIEEKLFEFDRKDDIPGYLVPSVYFEWLGSEDLELMGQVLEHNRLDILSLYFLFHILGDIYTSYGQEWEHLEDLHSLARLFDRRKEQGRTEKVFDNMARLDYKAQTDEMKLFQALTFKRSQKWELAIPILTKLSMEDSKEGFVANIELAKYLEHKKRDYSKALFYTENAKAKCPELSRYQGEISRRLDRLIKKIDKNKT